MKTTNTENATGFVELVIFADCPLDLLKKYQKVPYGEDLLITPEEFEQLTNKKIRLFERDQNTVAMVNKKEEALLEHVRELEEELQCLKSQGGENAENTQAGG